MRKEKIKIEQREKEGRVIKMEKKERIWQSTEMLSTHRLTSPSRFYNHPFLVARILRLYPYSDRVRHCKCTRAAVMLTMFILEPLRMRYARLEPTALPRNVPRSTPSQLHHSFRLAFMQGVEMKINHKEMRLCE